MQTATKPRIAVKPKSKVFHATVQVTRIEDWFVEADNAEAARELLESGDAQRSQPGECIHVEIEKLTG